MLQAFNNGKEFKDQMIAARLNTIISRSRNKNSKVVLSRKQIQRLSALIILMTIFLFRGHLIAEQGSWH